ncbi:MAG: hypothetical protein ACFFD4_01950 [Candidatus Odinarchaeota archaeon]
MHISNQIDLLLCIISILAIAICLLTIHLSYNRFKLTPILFYYGAFVSFLIGVLGIIPSTIITDPLQENFVTFSQALTFGLTFFGLLFLFLAISSSKGALLTSKSNVLTFLVGGTFIGYFNRDFYNLSFDSTAYSWDVHYHPFFLLFISSAMLIIVIDLISYARVILKTESGEIKRAAAIYFAGWVVLALSGAVFFLSRIDHIIPANLYLIFFSLGVFIISLIILKNPASLIASPLKVYNLTFMNMETGVPYLSYDFRTGEARIDPEMFSGVLTGVTLALSETIKGNRYLNKIDGIDRQILLERGLETQVTLTVEDETVLNRRILKRLLILFEMEFYAIIHTGTVGYVDTEKYTHFTDTIEKYFAFAF